VAAPVPVAVATNQELPEEFFEGMAVCWTVTWTSFLIVVSGIRRHGELSVVKGATQNGSRFNPHWTSLVSPVVRSLRSGLP
jgi:hypothetical protein